MPEPPDGFRPHVSLAYSNDDGPDRLPVCTLAGTAGATAEVTVRSVSLIDLNRDHGMYQWKDVATVLLGDT